MSTQYNTMNTEIILNALKKLNTTKPTKVQDLCLSTGLSWHYTNRVLLMLKRKGIVTTTYGRYGGFKVNKKIPPVKEIMLIGYSRQPKVKLAFIKKLKAKLKYNKPTHISKILDYTEIYEGNAYSYLTLLRKAGYIKAVRGKKGGWIKLKSATTKELMEAAKKGRRDARKTNS